ncbi:Gag-Pol polyprotein [Plakobranchus ocellatus]|uniref:Gag-Pol polyprotein n=1 Tax=Plakobranchus ocellatus TaxID=259542 RepID=A0AAV4D6J2_9GAST|nr:Gag-Pol polyprotein [Plakobranchus ocellatus]
MGFKDSASVRERLVSNTLADCPCTIVYISDIQIFGSTRVEHDENFRMALQRLSDKEFHLQLTQCEFAVPKITFLKHAISANGIQPGPKNVQPILDAPIPKTVKQIQRFWLW